MIAVFDSSQLVQAMLLAKTMVSVAAPVTQAEPYVAMAWVRVS